MRRTTIRKGAKSAGYRNRRSRPRSSLRVKALRRESSKYGEQAGPKIACGIDCIAMHSAEAHANCYDHQADHRRSEVGTGWRIELIDNGENQEQQQGSADGLIEKACLGQTRKGREGR